MSVKIDENILDSLNAQQRSFVTEAMSGKNIFLSGVAGTGKTYALMTAIELMKASGRNVLVTAPTGIAASLIDGITVHRALGYKPDQIIDMKKMRVNSKAAGVLIDYDTIVVDEISMVRIDLFDALWQSVKKAGKKKKKPIQLIVSGDFAQLAPVMKRDSREYWMLCDIFGENIGQGFAFLSRSWQECGFENLMLTEIFRQKNPYFIDVLAQLRYGMDMPKVLSYLDGLHYASHPDPNAVTLAATDKAVSRINKEKLDKLPEIAVSLEAFPVNDPTNPHPQPAPPAPLVLKKGARVIFNVNEVLPWNSPKMKPSYYNGTFGTVVDIKLNPGNHDYDRVYVMIDGTGEIVPVQRYLFEETDYRKEDGKWVRYTRRAYKAMPLELAYALTIHRAQGLTLDAVIIEPYCFAPGQLYVVMSRCKDPERIFLSYPARPEYVITAPEVLDFYENLKTYKPDRKKSKKAKPVTYPSSEKGGAPIRYKGASKVRKIPVEMIAPVTKLMAAAFPKNGSGTKTSVVERTLSFLNKSNSGIVLPEKPKKKFSKAKAMRIPTEIDSALDGFITRAYCGLDGSRERVLDFCKAVDAITEEEKIAAIVAGLSAKSN